MLFVGVVNSGIDWSTVAAFISALVAFLSLLTAKEAVEVSRQTVSISLIEQRKEAYKEMRKIFDFLNELCANSPRMAYPSIALVDYPGLGRNCFSITAEEVITISRVRERFKMYAPMLGNDLGSRCNVFIGRVFNALDAQRNLDSSDETKKIDAWDTRRDLNDQAKQFCEEIEQSLYLPEKSKTSLLMQVIKKIESLVKRK